MALKCYLYLSIVTMVKSRPINLCAGFYGFSA